MRAWRPEFSMWLEFAWLAHLPAERNTSSLYGDRRSIWCNARPLRKWVHQCKQRKFTPAPQISVYVGATTLGCGVGLIFFSVFFVVCVVNRVTFFHLITGKQTNWFCCYWWSAGCSSWINHKDAFDEGESSSDWHWGNLLSLLEWDTNSVWTVGRIM